ncbi:unnamed protein product, partial [Meganyctiphanes norvegica]
MAEPIRVCVTGAAGQIGYSLCYMLGSGAVFGPDQPVILQLLDIPPMMTVLQGVCMEISDCAMPCVREVIPTDDPAVAFKDIDAAFLVGAMPRKEGMERKDLLAANVKIFKVQGQALDQHAKKSVRVLVVGNPANTNALICANFAPSIPRENFSAMTRLDQNRAQAQIAQKLSIPVKDVHNVIIWGNHSGTQFPDVKHAMAKINGTDTPVYDAIKDDAFLKGDFITTVQKRGGAVIAARKLSSAMSAAKAACDHMKSIHIVKSRFVNMDLYLEGEYHSFSGLLYPASKSTSHIIFRKWTIVQGLPIDDFAREKMDATAKELCEERDDANEVC